MPDPIETLLEKLAERCISTAAGMLATTIASMQISHYAQRQQQLEELAQKLEEQGLTDLARTLRERAHVLTNEQSPSATTLRGDSQPQEGLLPTNGAHPLRRPGRRTKRPEEIANVSDAPSETSANPSVFFPLNSQPSDTIGESEQA
jgi:hypothetical protein